MIYLINDLFTRFYYYYEFEKDGRTCYLVGFTRTTCALVRSQRTHVFKARLSTSRAIVYDKARWSTSRAMKG